MTDRSLFTVVTDSFTGPRWQHHALKILTGAMVLGGCLLIVRASPVAA